MVLIVEVSMRVTVALTCAVAALWSAVILSAPQGSSPAAPGKREPLKIARLWADLQGVTHFEDITLLTGPPPQRGQTPKPGPADSVAALGLPLTGNVTFHRIPGNLVIPNPEPNGKPHTAPYRTFVFVLNGSGFWWNSGDNTKVEFRPGGTVLLADDTGSKGHNTAALGTETVFMFVPVGGGPAPRRP
jgi:hypothetical protein